MPAQLAVAAAKGGNDQADETGGSQQANTGAGMISVSSKTRESMYCICSPIESFAQA